MDLINFYKIEKDDVIKTLKWLNANLYNKNK